MTENIKSNAKTNFSLPILLYDDQCTLCTRFKQGLEKIPGTDIFLMESIHNEDIYSEFPELSRSLCLDEVHIIDENGVILSGADAVTNLVTRFPVVKNFTWLLDSDIGKRAVTSFYKALSRCRSELKKRCSTCK